MEKIENAAEAILMMKDGHLVTTDGKDFFIYRDERIHHYREGSHYSIPDRDFLELYGKKSFFTYEETVSVDETKDEAYYRYYRK